VKEKNCNKEISFTAITVQVNCFPFHLFVFDADPYGKKHVVFCNVNNVFYNKR